MHRRQFVASLLAAAAVPTLRAADLGAPLPGVGRRDDRYLLTGASWQAVVRAADGALLSFSTAAQASPIVTGGEFGLWRLRRGDVEVNAIGSCSAKLIGPTRQTNDGQSVSAALELTYAAPEQTVVLRLTPAARYLELSATVTNHSDVIDGVAIPGRLRFDVAHVRRVIVPNDGNDGVGLALQPTWFARQPVDRPFGWHGTASGDSVFRQIAGCAPDMRPVDDPEVALAPTEAGRAIFGDALSTQIAAAKESVFSSVAAHRAEPGPGRLALRPLFAAHQVGAGRLWRFGGHISAANSELATQIAAATIRAAATGDRAAHRPTIAVINLYHGPTEGGFSRVSVADWIAALRKVAVNKSKFVELTTLADLVAALDRDDVSMIVNPYGESFPTSTELGATGMAAKIKRYLSAGGEWLEVGGYPFFVTLTPTFDCAFATQYPAAFADFVHVDTTAGGASLYRVQPRNWPAWSGATDPTHILVPSELRVERDAQGGCVDRWFATWVKRDQSWTAPTVRLGVPGSPERGLSDYAQANGLTRPLSAKIKPEAWAKLRESVLVYVGGPAQDKIATLDALPSPCVLHFADYLHGGFDKQYPDHLPPNAWFGTSEQLKSLYDEAHARGLLVCPYTNPTWWCIGPKGPTFERCGDAPLLRLRDGQPNHEKYAANEGYEITQWHPDVRAANQLTRRQFTQDYPSDVLFQDQIGARNWHWDTNPAEPAPYASTEGLLSELDDDCAVTPLATEAGWDGVLNGETMLCGLSWRISPHQPERNFSHEYPRETYQIYPLAERLAHDKAMLLYHDLGQFCTDAPTLAWALALGFSLSYTTDTATLRREWTQSWLRWLAQLQKSVVAPTLGQPLLSFANPRFGDNDGGVSAAYRTERGPMSLRVNLTDAPLTVDGQRLPAYGFGATGPGLRAGGGLTADGDAIDATGWIASGDDAAADVWILDREGARVGVRLPNKADGGQLTLDGRSLGASAKGGALNVELPRTDVESAAQPPAAYVKTAPRDWPGAQKSIGVIDFGLGGAWSTVNADGFVAALSASTLVTRDGYKIERLKSAEAVTQALERGPLGCLAIVNPLGELFPTVAAGAASATTMLTQIEVYVRSGGIWWETAGLSFCNQAYRDGEAFKSAQLDHRGAAQLGLPIGTGLVEQPAEPLQTTPTGRAWFGDALANAIDGSTSAINRGLPRGADDPGHVALVRGREENRTADDFIGGYRLGGWGWLMRIGGFNPEPRVVTAAVVGSLQHLASVPPEPDASRGALRFWQLKWSR